MAKTIATLGFEIPGHPDKYISPNSDRSLLDYDIIVLKPAIHDCIDYGLETHMGKPVLTESASFRLKERADRWRREILGAFEHGKTVFIFMPEIVHVYVDSGNRAHSGTGRNRSVTKMVDPFNNYLLLPITFTELVSARGREMKPARDPKLLSAYWKEFGPISEYEVYFTAGSVLPLLLTKTGSKTVAGIIQDKPGTGKGTIILLPPLNYDSDEFSVWKEGGAHWNKKGIAFGSSLIAALLEVDKVITSGKQQTPVPEWAISSEFRMPRERELEKQVSELNAQIEGMQNQKRGALQQLENEGTLRRLLYETGEPLEDAILDALRILGLKAVRFKTSESEFDAVFTWEGHRFLGEAEGKDSKAINVDKISQLERNLGEDFAREDVNEYAKGVLFGNAFRLQELVDRAGYFTEKCISTAKRLKAALVRTPDLFIIARYVKESGDSGFARKCIEAILSAEGTIVAFPPVPSQAPESVEETKPIDSPQEGT